MARLHTQEDLQLEVQPVVQAHPQVQYCMEERSLTVLRLAVEPAHLVGWEREAVAECRQEQQDTIMELTRPMDTMEDLRSILEPHGVLQRLEERPYITIQHRINIRSSAQHFEFPRLFKSNNGS